MSVDSARYRFAIIIPNFAHPLLAMETLACVLAQDVGQMAAAVIVNDGSLMPSTAMHCRAASVRYSNVYYIEKSNGGLSSARNAGINFVLEQFESVEIIMCLDSDDRIGPHLLNTVDEVFSNNHWADFAILDHFTFGLSGQECGLFSYEGNYRLIEHIFQNLTGASTIYRRRVFAGGLRYDETMREGFEDWEFGLRVGKAGFDGIHVPDAGFRYRVRPESMLAESRRVEAEIRGYMRRKHAELYAARTLLALEHQEFPRVAVVTAEDQEVRAVSDPRLLHSTPPIPWLTYAEQLLYTDDDQLTASVPRLAIFTTRSAVPFLLTGVSGPQVVWSIQSLIRSCPIVLVRVRTAGEEGPVVMRCGVDSLSRVEEADAIVISPDLLKAIMEDSSADWLVEVFKGAPIDVKRLTLEGAFVVGEAKPELPQGSILPLVLTLLLQAKVRRRRTPWFSGVKNVRLRSGHESVTRKILGSAELLPIVPTAAVDVAFLLPIARLGGAERVTHNVAASFAKSGMRCHLVIVGANDALLPMEHRSTYTSISFVKDFVAKAGWRESYMGVGIPGRGVGDTDPLLGALMCFDVVVNVNVPEASLVMAQLRVRGVATLLYLHANGQSPFGRVDGQGVMGLPYEHAYDFFVVVSQGLRSFLLSRGVPNEKVVLVKNQPAFEVTSEDADEAMDRRVDRVQQPLRVLYLGRLDPRKGILRLREVIDRLKSSQVSVNFRLVGEISYFGQRNDGEFEKLINSLGQNVHPPSDNAEDVKKHLRWADVIVLPSYAEGAPLSLIEGAAFGCVPITTDVGSVREYIDDGIDGFVIDPSNNDEAVIRGFVDVIERLAHDRNLVLAMGRRAMTRHQEGGWDEAVKDLAHALDARLARRRAACALEIRDVRRRAMQNRHGDRHEHTEDRRSRSM